MTEEKLPNSSFLFCRHIHQRLALIVLTLENCLISCFLNVKHNFFHINQNKGCSIRYLISRLGQIQQKSAFIQAILSHLAHSRWSFFHCWDFLTHIWI